MSESPKIFNRDEDIRRLEIREHVRKRPGMYIGGIDQRAMHYLIYEIVDHSIGLVFAGLCNQIWVTLRENNEANIRDNGTEISVDIYKATGRPLLESFMTQIGVSNERVHGFPEKRYTGLDALGLWTINALSERLTIESTYNGYLWTQDYREGIPQSQVTRVRALEADEPRGISITLRPDFTIFEHHDFNYDAVISHLRETAYLAGAVTITIVDERKSPALKTDFYFPDGMADAVRDCNAGRTVLHDIIHYRGTYVIERHNRQEEIGIEFALQYTDTNETVIKSYVNTWCMDGGTHVEGLQAGLVDAINAKAMTLIEKPFTWDDVKGGLTVALNVKLDDPSFESQTNINLMNSQAYEAVAKMVYHRLTIEDQSLLKAIIAKCQANHNLGRS